jgi:transposase
MRKARALPKTNKRDADLVSMLPQESKPWWRVWRAPPDVRDLREWMRHRMGLVGMQTEVKNRVHALFHRHGIFYEEATDLFGGLGRQFLFALCDQGRHENGTLPEGALEALRSDVRMLTMLRAELATITWRLRGRLKRDPLVRRLMTIPGIGLILAHVLASEIGDIGRFKNHRQLASYACLAPQCDDTGEPAGIGTRYLFLHLAGRPTRNRNSAQLRETPLSGAGPATYFRVPAAAGTLKAIRYTVARNPIGIHRIIGRSTTCDVIAFSRLINPVRTNAV